MNNTMPTYQDELYNKAQAMLRQTQAEGNTPFTGSTYDASAPRVTPYAQPVLPTAPVPTTTITNEPVITPVSGLPTSIVTPPLRPLYKESLDEKALREATARETQNALDTSNQIANEEQTRRDVIAQMQAEINAQNALYADKLARAKLEGAARVGEAGAIQARRGLLGSDFGVSQSAKVASANEQIYGSIENERNAAVQSLLSRGREMGTTLFAEKTAAKKAGLSEYIKSLSGAVDSAKKRAIDIAKYILAGTISLDKYDPDTLEQTANDAGVSVNQIKTAYDEQKKLKDAEALKLKTDAEKFAFDIQKGRPASVQEYEYAKANGYVGTYSQYQDDDANRKAVIAKASTLGLTPYQQFTATQSISKDTQARTENAREMARQAELIQNSYNNIVNGKDRSLNTQAMIVSFNKILDPTSVVRESEYDRTAAGQALISRLQGKVENILIGGAGVTEATLKEASDIAKQYLTGARATIVAQNQRAIKMATQFGLNPDFVGSVSVPGDSITTDSLTITDPNGVSHTFQTIDQANAFKKAAGL